VSLTIFQMAETLKKIQFYRDGFVENYLPMTHTRFNVSFIYIK